MLVLVLVWGLSFMKPSSLFNLDSNKTLKRSFCLLCFLCHILLLISLFCVDKQLFKIAIKTLEQRICNTAAVSFLLSFSRYLLVVFFRLQCFKMFGICFKHYYHSTARFSKKIKMTYSCKMKENFNDGKSDWFRKIHSNISRRGTLQRFKKISYEWHLSLLQESIKKSKIGNAEDREDRED